MKSMGLFVTLAIFFAGQATCRTAFPDNVAAIEVSTTHTPTEAELAEEARLLREYSIGLLANVIPNYKGKVDCECREFTCICCTPLTYHAIQEQFCTRFDYSPEYAGVGVTLFINDTIAHQKSVSLIFPSPLCIVLQATPDRKPPQLCGRIYIEQIGESTLDLCYDVDFFMPDNARLDMHFACMKIGTNQTANEIQDTTVLVEHDEQVTKDLSNGKATDKTNTDADSAHQQRHRRSARK